MFSSIEDGKALHLADGRSFEVAITSTVGDSNLKDYTLTDLRLEKENGGYSNGSVSSAYTLYYKDGKREYFSSDGRLIGIKDRYNNTIKLVHDKLNSQPRITVTDTLNRVTTISSSAITSGARTVTVALPSSVNLKYTVTNLTSPISCSSLTAYADPMSVTTNYSYTVSSGGFNAWDKNTNGATNYFMNLTTITHPTGAASEFNWVQISKNLGSSGLQACFRLTLRRDKTGSVVYNEKTYNYSANNNSGYPANYDPSNLPTGFTYSTTVTTTASGISDINTFNNKHLTTLVETKHGSKKVEDRLYEYNANKLPIKATTKTYDHTNNSTFAQKIEMAEYDVKANVTASWSPLANGNTSNTEYKTVYGYNMDFSQPVSVTYKQNSNTTVAVNYTLDSQNRHPLTETITVNSVQKGRTDWSYDSFGNILTERRYKDGGNNISNSILKTYTYLNNAYLSSSRVDGVKTADGANVTGSPTYAAGTIAAKYEYDNLGRPTKMTDPRGNATQYQYNAKNDLIKVTNPDNTMLQYARSYTANHITVTDGKGNQLKTSYNALGMPYELIDVQTNTVLDRKTYDSLCRLETNADLVGGATTVYTYDHISRIASATIKQGPTTLAQENYAYSVNSAGLYKTTITQVGDANAQSIVTTYYVNNMGFETQTGAMLSGTEHVNTYAYDYVGNIVQTLSALDASKGRAFTSKFEYDYAGRVTKETNTLNQSVIHTFDALGRNTGVTDPSGNITVLSYDDIGRLVKQETPFEVVGGTVYKSVKKYDYDQTGNVIREQTQNNAPGATASWAKTEYVYNNRDLLTDVNSYNGANIAHQVKYTYDAVGNILTQRTGIASGNYATTTYTYDRFCNVLTVKDALNQTESYAYNLVGHLLGKTDRNGAVTTYSNDALGRVLSANVTRNSVNIGAMGQTYTLTGQIKTQSNNGFSVTNTYDALGRLTQANETGNVIKTYNYDIIGNRTGFALAVNGAAKLNTSYEYDELSRLKLVKESNVTQATYTYDTNGNRASLAYPNGVTATYTYNLANLVTGLQNKKGAAVQSSYAYTYYLDGNQRTKTDHTGCTGTYLYDGLGRLTSEVETGLPVNNSYVYTYDARSNRESLTVTGLGNYTVDYQYDLNNRLMGTTKTAGYETVVDTYRYDPNGNTISRLTETFSPANANPAALSLHGDGWEINEYNGFNQLITTIKDGAEIGYAYKPDGSRLSKTVDGVTTTHLWDGGNIVAELAGSAVKDIYLRGINLIYKQESSVKEYYSYNAHGDVVQLADSLGNVTKDYKYDAFGNDIGTTQSGGSGSTDGNPFRFAGEYFDTETGTYYLRARYYNPAIGRFLSEDTYWNTDNMVYGDNPRRINERQDTLWLNAYTLVPDITAIMQSGCLYSYCINNPVLYADPTGNLLFPGEIHNAVSNRIVITQSLQGRQIFANVGIPTGEKNILGRPKYIYADLVDVNSVEIWEIKPDAPVYHISGSIQLQKYIDTVKAMGGVVAAPGGSLGSETFYHVSMGKLSMVPSLYKVTYTSYGNGVIYYSYKPILDADLVAIAAAMIAIGITSGQFSPDELEGLLRGGAWG